jgi:glucose-6-phosphate isomerase
MDIRSTEAWQRLARHRESLGNARMTELFDADPTRAGRYRISCSGLTLDYGRNLITDETLDLLGDLADEVGIANRIQAMLSGELLNVTEERAALHTLLRASPGDIPAGLSAEAREVSHTLVRVESIATRIRDGEWTGATGKPITQVVTLGIGGSYLGPRMVTEALTPCTSSPVACHFVANVDGHHIDGLLSQLDQEETLFIVVSKSFSTLETKLNAASARDWLLDKMAESELSRHVIAVSANLEAATTFGIDEDNVLPMWDWVGGRYSLWSAVGLPIAIAAGFQAFRELLDGAAELDRHLATTTWPNNMPMMLALLGAWYNNFFGTESHAVLPYDHFLRLLPAHLQQLDMESNGKSVTRDGNPVDVATGPVIWGGEGTNGQHAFHQLLHQGTKLIGVDFILPLRPHHERIEHHDWLVANCLAQSQALMTGRTTSEPWRDMPGNRPSNMILVEQVTPRNLGTLIALYEHKVFCQAMIWHINPFDQWGVELGKVLGDSIHAAITGGNESIDDPATAQLIANYRSSLK